MSVMIKGMEMPGNCGKCKMHFIGHSNYVCCGITDRIPKIVDSFRDSKTDLDTRIKSIEAVKRPYWCPLVEIPTPHGRLIDEAIILEMIRKSMGIKDLSFLYHAEKSIVNEIYHAPTVIEAEDDYDGGYSRYIFDNEEDEKKPMQNPTYDWNGTWRST